jgi:hypothetical protein
MQNVLQATAGKVEYRHTIGEISVVRIVRLEWDLDEYALPTSLRKCQMEYYGRFWLGMEK